MSRDMGTPGIYPFCKGHFPFSLVTVTKLFETFKTYDITKRYNFFIAQGFGFTCKWYAWMLKHDWFSVM